MAVLRPLQPLHPTLVDFPEQVRTKDQGTLTPQGSDGEQGLARLGRFTALLSIFLL